LTLVHSIDSLPNTGRLTGFVPTMGAFHEGHLSLIRRAKSETEHVVVSLFVNPLQFGKNEDLARYPRNLERDRDLAAEAGADVLFAPSPEEIYRGAGTVIHVNELSERWEGEARPGHFDGVATVVNKLFNIVKANRCYFGLKDLQQCMILRRMVHDLNMREELVFCPTVREADGLAMSSRNVYLSEEQRSLAPSFFQALQGCRQSILSREQDPGACIDAAKRELVRSGFAIGYFEWIDLPDMGVATHIGGEQALIGAVNLGNTRLIDNVVL
jgi:pantoate--beta-alanine ligase